MTDQHDHKHGHDHSGHDHADHSHAHGHSHSGHDHGAHGGHTHHEPPKGFDAAFALGAVLNLGFVGAETVYGFLANSVALLADAAHNFGDVVGLLLAWGAAVLGRRLPTAQRTYGYGRSSILASLTNAVVLLISVGAIALEAGKRLLDTSEQVSVAAPTVMAVAAIGIVVNGVTAFLFASGRKGDLNVRGAFMHMAADAAVSAGVVVSGLVIMLTDWHWLDPAVSLAISALIAVSTWGLLRDSVNLAMDAIPAGVNRQAVEDYLKALPGVTAVHDLHIWGISTTENALTAHLVRPGAPVDDDLLRQISAELKRSFRIGHTTLQMENSAECELAPAHVV